MSHHRLIGILVAPAVLSACAGDVVREPNSNPDNTFAGATIATIDDTVIKRQAGTVFSTIKTTDGHQFAFGRTESGALVAEETGPVGSQPVLPILAKNIRAVADLYVAISNGATPAEALRAPIPLLQLTAPQTAPPPPRTQREELLLSGGALSVDQSWFQNSICNNAIFQGYNGICYLGAAVATISPVEVYFNTDRLDGQDVTSFYLSDRNGDYTAAGVIDSAINSISSFGAIHAVVWTGSEWFEDWTTLQMSGGTWWYGLLNDYGPTYRATTETYVGSQWMSFPAGVAMGTGFPNHLP
jgi:hypothetical protein